MSYLCDADRSVALATCADLLLQARHLDREAGGSFRAAREIRAWAALPPGAAKTATGRRLEPADAPLGFSQLMREASGRRREFVEATLLVGSAWHRQQPNPVDFDVWMHEITASAVRMPWIRTDYTPKQLRKLPAKYQIAWDLVSSTTPPEVFDNASLVAAHELTRWVLVEPGVTWQGVRPLAERLTEEHLSAVAPVLGLRQTAVGRARCWIRAATRFRAAGWMQSERQEER